MSSGISTNRRLTQSQVTALAGAGIEFVFRYYAASSGNTKTITPAESQLLESAGIAIATVYEQRGGAGDHPEDFTIAMAERDAQAALSMAQLISQPTGSAIYFGVDHDFESQHFVETTLVNYFNRIAAVFRQANGGTLSYPLGVYGSGMVCRVLRARCPDVRYAWLAESTGWTDSGNYNDWDVKQFVNHGDTIGTLNDFERCRSDDDFGAFRLNGPAGNPAQPVLVMQPATATTVAASAEFAMELGSSAALRSGILTLKDGAGQKLIQVSATSGRAGKQTSGNLWVPGVGPIPEGQPYQISTLQQFPEGTPFTGIGFKIQPGSIKSPTGVERGGFYLHGLENSEGTRGGVAIAEPSALKGFAAALVAAQQAGINSIPLSVKYTSPSATPPAAIGLPTQAVFSMDLRETSQLIVGTLVLLDANGGEVFRARATSGLATHQHRGDLWLSNHGPIPDIPDPKTILTKEEWSDLLGWKFYITPETFRANHQARGAFRVHKDGGTPGSAGCIVIRDEDDFQHFREIMRHTSQGGVASLTLEVDYNG